MGHLFRNLIFTLALLLVIAMTLLFRPGTENFIGALESTDRVIATEASGLVSDIYVVTGDHVQKGQLLLEISDINLDILINETEGALKSLKAQRRMARGMLESPQDTQNPVDIEIAQLEKDLKLKREKKKSQMVYALQDGVIGSVDVLVGQPVQPFIPLMTFYSNKPRIANGFVHDTAVVDLAIGQQVLVQSATDPMKTAIGQVVGIGQRYTNFPLRLKPAYQLTEVWGQEVDVLMPEDHKFLPAEKVNISVQSGPYNILKKGLNVAIGSR